MSGLGGDKLHNGGHANDGGATPSTPDGDGSVSGGVTQPRVPDIEELYIDTDSTADGKITMAIGTLCAVIASVAIGSAAIAAAVTVLVGRARVGCRRTADPSGKTVALPTKAIGTYPSAFTSTIDVEVACQDRATSFEKVEQRNSAHV